jgi:GTPase SAR1 family protein
MVLNSVLHWWGLAAALLVYDLLDKDSFDRVQSWVKELRKMASKNIVLAIAGNKSDMDKLRQVDLKESERLVLISARSCAARF